MENLGNQFGFNPNDKDIEEESGSDMLEGVNPGKKPEEYAKIIEESFNKSNYDLITRSPKSLKQVESSKRKFIIEGIFKKGSSTDIENLLANKNEIGFYLDEAKTDFMLQKLKEDNKDQTIFDYFKDLSPKYRKDIFENLKIDFENIDVGSEKDLWNLAYYLKENPSDAIKAKVREQIKELQGIEEAREYLSYLVKTGQYKSALFFLRAAEYLGYKKEEILGEEKEELLQALTQLPVEHSPLVYGSYPDNYPKFKGKDEQ